MNAVPESFAGTIGALLIGSLVTAVFYGITSVQTYIYSQSSASDHALLRRTVYILWGLDTLQFSFLGHSLYHYTVINYMNPASLLRPPWSLLTAMSVGIFSDLVVSCIYMWRIRRLGGHWIIVVILAVSAVTICAAALDVVVYSVIHSNLTITELNPRVSWAWCTTYSVKAFSDILTAISLCVILKKHRSGIRRTDSLLHAVMVYTINTCALTSVLSLIVVLSYVTLPTTFAFMGTSCVFPKMMLNSLLGLLNSRDSFRSKNTSGPMSIHLSQLPSATSSKQKRSETRAELEESYSGLDPMVLDTGSKNASLP